MNWQIPQENITLDAFCSLLGSSGSQTINLTARLLLMTLNWTWQRKHHPKVWRAFSPGDCGLGKKEGKTMFHIKWKFETTFGKKDGLGRNTTCHGERPTMASYKKSRHFRHPTCRSNHKHFFESIGLMEIHKISSKCGFCKTDRPIFKSQWIRRELNFNVFFEDFFLTYRLKKYKNKRVRKL